MGRLNQPLSRFFAIWVSAVLLIMANAGSIDLLLTDVILPQDMSGRDVARAFRERYPSSGIL